VYAPNSAAATSSLAEESSRYNFQPPFTATYLSESTDPVSLGAAAPTATSSSSDESDGTDVSDGSGVIAIPGLGTPSGSSAGMGITGTGVLGAILVAAVGGLAFGL
jgi:hypothetical protein